MSTKENINNNQVFPLFYQKKEYKKLYFFDKHTNDNTGLIEGHTINKCLKKAKLWLQTSNIKPFNRPIFNFAKEGGYHE